MLAQCRPAVWPGPSHGEEATGAARPLMLPQAGIPAPGTPKAPLSGAAWHSLRGTHWAHSPWGQLARSAGGGQGVGAHSPLLCPRDSPNSAPTPVPRGHGACRLRFCAGFRGGVSLGLDSWGSSPGPQPGGSQSSLCGPEGGHWAGREAGVCQRPARRESPLCVGGGGPGLPEDGGPGCAIPPAVWRGGTQSPVPHPRPAGGLPSQSHPKSLPLPGSRGPCRKVRPELEKWRTQAISLLGPCPSAWGRFLGGGRSWVSRKP